MIPSRSRANHDGSISAIGGRRANNALPTMRADQLEADICDIVSTFDAVSECMASILETDINTDRFENIHMGDKQLNLLLNGKMQFLQRFRDFMSSSASTREDDQDDQDNGDRSLRSLRRILQRARNKDCLEFWNMAWTICAKRHLHSDRSRITRLWEHALPLFVSIKTTIGGLPSDGLRTNGSRPSAAAASSSTATAAGTAAPAPPATTTAIQDNHISKSLCREALRSISFKLSSLEEVVRQRCEVDKNYEPNLRFDCISDGLKADIAKFQAIRLARKRKEPVDVAILAALQSNLTAAVTIAILFSCLLLAPCWKFSETEPGTYEDADFYFAIQAFIMSSLGFWTSIKTLSIRSYGRPWFWAVLTSVVGVVVSAVSIPVYVVLPKTWCPMLAFVSSVLQAAMTLQLSIMAIEMAAKREKGD